ncbi:peptidylprolyl isomerase [Accumulibacter sp.]|uniref:peptidylprolyl isomerase n=1 Tax=Accumulibacter sp. TaxID=2053492 RepID=UPI0025E8073F|nr:peptidylprolyl isomerase [Accumulibacter sp.]MCP5227421.1 peptidylprolyl isomerase [Accumulibacter sp.]
MKFIKSRLLLASAASLLVISACDSDQKSAAPPRTKEAVVAIVNGTAINKSRVDMIIEHGASDGEADTPEVRKSIIDKLAMQTLIAEDAVKKGLDKLPAVTEQLDVLRQSVLAEAYVQDFIKNNPVSDDMLKAEYERIKATVTGSEYKARHILVETEAEAREIIAQLKKDPGSFEKLAMEKSRDAGSRVRGGDLGWFDVSRMVPEFSSAVSKLEKGAFTQQPVKTQYGYHVILLEDSRPIEAPPLEEVKAALTQYLQQQNLKKQLDDLKARARIELVEAPGVTAK